MDQEEIYKELTKPFPQNAYSADVSRGKKNPMTSIKAQYIKERLNSVLGFYGWKLQGDFKVVGEGEEATVLYFGVLSIYDEDILVREVETIGASGLYQKTKDGMRKKNVGDVYKSAQTDCLSKAASFIGIGNSVFKGHIKAVENGNWNYLFQDVTPATECQELLNETISLYEKVKGVSATVEVITKMSEQTRPILIAQIKKFKQELE